MLDKVVFLQGLKKINTLYREFKFDFEDKFALNVWYDFFKDYSNEQYTNIIDIYCKNNKYTPMSAASIVDYYLENVKTQTLRKELSPSDAWVKMIETRRECRFIYNKVIEKLKEYPIIYEAYLLHEDTILNMTNSDRVFIEREWKQTYTELLNKNVREKVETLALPNNDSKKMIENKKGEITYNV